MTIGAPANDPKRRPFSRAGLPVGRSGFAELLLQIAADLGGPGGKLVDVRLQQILIEPAAMIDRAQRRRGDAQLEGAPQRFARQRHVHEVRLELALRLDVGVADLVANLAIDAG
jgi:hypothetical protein